MTWIYIPIAKFIEIKVIYGGTVEFIYYLHYIV